MPEKELLLMSYLTDLGNLNRHLARLSQEDISLYTEDLLQVLKSLSSAKTLLEGRLLFAIMAEGGDL